MTTIENLLNRRLDLSTFLVHFTRDKDDCIAYENLVSILKDHCLNAGSKLGTAKDRDVPNQEVVCFTETPLEHAWTLTGAIQGRQVQLEPYGVVFSKIWARSREVNPVWYVDATRGHDWTIKKSIERLVKSAWDAGDKTNDIFQLTPFIEVMGTWPRNKSRKEFWWEREWRKIGDLTFDWSNLVAVIAPENSHDQLRKALGDNNDVDSLKFLDATWGLERMIGSFAGIHPDHLGPLPKFF